MIQTVGSINLLGRGTVKLKLENVMRNPRGGQIKEVTVGGTLDPREPDTVFAWTEKVYEPGPRARKHGQGGTRAPKLLNNEPITKQSTPYTPGSKKR